MVVILMPAYANPLLQNPLYIKNTKKSSPKCVSLITWQIYFYLLAFAEQKEVGKHIYIYLVVVSSQGQNKIQSFECIFQTANITKNIRS
jgi:hypothetical protein